MREEGCPGLCPDTSFVGVPLTPKTQLVPSWTPLIQRLDPGASSLRLSALGWALPSFSCPPEPWESSLNTMLGVFSCPHAEGDPWVTEPCCHVLPSPGHPVTIVAGPQRLLPPLLSLLVHSTPFHWQDALVCRWLPTLLGPRSRILTLAFETCRGLAQPQRSCLEAPSPLTCHDPALLASFQFLRLPPSGSCIGGSTKPSLIPG